MTYDECCSGRDWRVHTTKRLWLGFGRSIHRDISSIHHSQMLSSLLLGSISICQPKKTRNHCKLTPKILTVVKQLRFQKFKLHPCFLSVNFQNNHIFQAPLPPPRFRFRCLVFYHQHFFSQSRRRLVGLPPWKEVQLTSHLKGSWVLTWG